MAYRPQNRKVSAWFEERLSDRLERCRRMLVFHGIATDKESREMLRRIKRLTGKRTTQRMSRGASDG